MPDPSQPFDARRELIADARAYREHLVAWRDGAQRDVELAPDQDACVALERRQRMADALFYLAVHDRYAAQLADHLERLLNDPLMYSTAASSL